MEEEEYQGVSFGRICKVAFHRWKLLLILTFSICLVGFFGVYFGYNYFFNVYNATFSYSGSGLATETMADNTTFNYKSLISKETLEAVKASDEKYAGIDVEGLRKDNAFSISRSIDKDTNEISYTISIKRNKMPSADITRDFFSDLANYPLEKDRAYVADSSFDSALKKLDTVEKFEDQVDLLSTQANTLIAGYNAMKGLNISTTLSDKIASNIYSINSTIDSQKVSLLKNMIINYGLAPDYSKIDIDSLSQQKIVLYNEDVAKPGEYQNNATLIDAIEAEIKELTGAGSSIVTSLSERMESLIVRNHNIKLEVRQIEAQIANFDRDPEAFPEHKQFVKETTKIKNELYDEIDDYKVAMKEVYVDNAEVSFANSNILDVTKSMSLIFSILIPLAAGFVVGIIVNLIVDRKMLYEEETPVAAQ